MEKKTKSKSSKKHEIDETQPNAIKEKTYVSEEIETSITLLESPEKRLVLEAVLFLSKYADVHRNNLVHIQGNGVLPKLLALLDHNICILRVSLRLLSQLLTLEEGRVELNQEKFDEAILKICGFFVQGDVCVKEFSGIILSEYCKMGKSGILLKEPNLITTILKSIKQPENDTILLSSLELFYKFIEFDSVRSNLPEIFIVDTFYEKMNTMCLPKILEIFEKLTYFCEDPLQLILKNHNLVEKMVTLVMETNNYLALKIVLHCMNNENSDKSFVTSLEFLKFSQWAQTCDEEAAVLCSEIFLRLSKMDSIRQVLFDLNIEDTILSFLRSDDKKVLNATYDAIASMSKHKFCCEKMLTPVVIKKLLLALPNEMALSTLYYFSRRDSRTIHMIRNCDGIEVLLKSVDKSTTTKKLLEMFNMFVTNNQLQRLVLSPLLYDVILQQTLSQTDEICMRCLEIMINCLSHKDFRNYFLVKGGAAVIEEKLAKTNNEEIVRFIIIFLYKALMYDSLATEFIYKKILLVLKKLPKHFQIKIGLIQKVINLIYDRCLPIKFHETGRLELADRITDKFYLINGPWKSTFPFLEVLELRRISTKSTIYVIENLDLILPETQSEIECLEIEEKNDNQSVSSLNQLKCCISYGALSPDPYIQKYFKEISTLLSGIQKFEYKIKILADFVQKNLSGPDEVSADSKKLHTFKMHLECLKQKLGTNMIPIGYLRLGFHCERALLFKALCDRLGIPVALVRGKNKIFWNEVAILEEENGKTFLKMHVVDLMKNVGKLLPLGSRECNIYCNLQ